ncbi:MAG: S9 family peptidase [Candidatus Hodarchaeota archaeon]
MSHKNKAKLPKLRYTFEQLANVRWLGGSFRPDGCTFSPDSKQMIIVIDLDGQRNLWLMPTMGGFPVQLTFFKDRTVRRVKWSPVSNQIAFTADHKGNELEQLYLLDLDAEARPRLLIDNPEKRYMLSQWSPDGKFLYFATDDRNPRALDVVRIEVTTGKQERLTEEDKILEPERSSPKGNYLPISETFGNDHSTIHLLDLETGKRHELTPHTERARYYFQAWSQDNRNLYVTTDDGSEFMRLIQIDVETNKQKIIAEPQWDILMATTSKDGRWLAYTINRGGHYIIVLRNLETEEERFIGEESPALRVDLKFTPDSRYLVFIQMEATRAGDYHIFDMENGSIRRVTNSMSGGVRSEHLIAPELVQYESFDRPIPAWLYLPKGEGPFPCILSIHGGPQIQEIPFYYHFYQCLLQAGIAILAPNIRGSAGYGKTYMRLIRRDWGGDELRDIEAAAKFLKAHPKIDGERIGVYGDSFGGFAVLSALTRLPDYWRAAIDIVGPSNLVTFLEAIPEFWKPMVKELVGDINDPEDRKFLIERSPITYIDQAKTPILIIQGANDPRVVKTESDQMVEALRKKRVHVEYLVFEDEGHGFTKTENAIRAWKQSAKFFFEHLLVGVPEEI